MRMSLGGTEHNRVEIKVDGYEREPAGDYYDDNWLMARVRIAVGAFQGAFRASFQAHDFSGFLVELETVYATLKGVAEFRPLEEQLVIKAIGDGRGHIAIAGQALDSDMAANRLVFNFEIDQTDLALTIRQLKQLTAAFPVR